MKRSRSQPEGLLRVAVSGFCIGWSLWLFGKLGSQTGAWLLVMHDVTHSAIGQGERSVGWVLLAVSLAIWLPKAGVLAAMVAALAAFDAAIGAMMRSYVFAELTIPAHGLRIATPLCLALWAAASIFRRERLAWIGTWTLRLGAAAVFASHGLEAMLGHPRFEDFLIGSMDGFFGVALTESQVGPILIAIGVMDSLLALALLSGRLRPLLLLAAGWGLITALARVTTYGWDAYIEVLLRLPHVAAPLALWMIASPSRSSESASGGEDANSEAHAVVPERKVSPHRSATDLQEARITE